MAIEDPKDLDQIDQEIRINELKEKASELSKGKMLAWESEECPPDLAESFWQHVVDYENAPMTCHYEQLLEAGMDLPEPQTMTDKQLTAKLWEVIESLADMRVLLYQTNHLSDRQLYTHLWTDSLREQVADMSFDEDSAWTIDILGGCSEEDIYLQHKYYANDEDRERWLKEFPEDRMPAHEDPPYDRDGKLPKSGF